MRGCSGNASAGAGDEGGHDVGGVAVEGLADPVIAHRRSRIGVRGCFLDVAERHARIEGGGEKRVPQAVRADPLRDTGLLREAAHHPGGGVASHAGAGRSDEDRTRPFHPFADGQIDRRCGTGCQRDGDGLAAFAVYEQSSVASFQAERRCRRRGLPRCAAR